MTPAAIVREFRASLGSVTALPGGHADFICGGKHHDGENNMKKQIIYGVLAVLGITLTWYHNIQFALEHGSFALDQFIADCFVNHAASSITWDVTIAAIAFLTWSNIESKRLQMKGWIAIPFLTLGIALAFALPLYLLLRERHLARQKATV